MALLDRLENDRSLARFAGQFVPLKVVTDNNPDWGKWSRMYSVEGNGIPRLYVVRADGEMLYGAVGSLPGDQLPKMMLAALQQSGRSFNDIEATLVDNATNSAKTLLEEGDTLAASLALSEITSLGSPDDLGSYAKPAIAAGELYEQLVSAIEQQVDASQARLSAGLEASDALKELIGICEAEASYELFPKLKGRSGSVTRDLKKQAEYTELLAQADSLVKARLFAKSSNPKFRSRAAGAYTTVIRRFPGTAVDELARKELELLDPDAKILDMEPESLQSQDEFRVWKAKTGNYSVTAKYVQQKSGKVQLEKQDGSKIVVDIAVLSEEDQAYLRQDQ